MLVRLLGPVDVVRTCGTPLTLSGLRRKAILAVLALHSGEVVSADRLIDLVWREPAGLNTVQAHVSYLRRVLGDRSAITARPPGYLLDLETDVRQAEQLVRAGQQASDPAVGARSFRSALALWRDRPLLDVTDVPWLAEQADRLTGLELEARRALIDARLQLGEHGRLLPELTELAHRHPFDETVQGQLVLALYRAGRQTDALAVLRDTRARLDAELGIDPGPALRQLEEAVLRQDETLTRPAAVAVRRPDAGFIGRTAELSTLAEVAAGSCPAVAVSGDPGIGKTRLLGEWARRTGRLVLWGRATEFEQQAPFAIITDALAEVGADQVRSLPDEELALLREILPALPGGTATLLGAERYRLHRAVRALLEAVAEPDGLVLVLDDLHWADDGSAELLGHLLRHPPRGRVLLVMSYRPRQLAGRLRHALGRAHADGVLHSLELGPLAPEEVDRLLPAGLDTRARSAVHEAACGNPFYAQALANVDVTALEIGEYEDGLPAPVRAALAAELDALEPAEELVAKAAAVVAGVVEPDLVAHTAELTVPEVLGALDTLVRRDLLRPIRHTGQFDFRHPLVRRAAYDAAGSGWRIAAHARAAETLRLRGAPAAEQARHIALSAQPGDLCAMAVLRDAAAGAMRTSPAAAERWLGAALRLVPGDRIRLELLGLRAQALGLIGRLKESRETVRELLDLLPVDPTETRASLVALCAWIEQLLGRHGEAKALLLTELDRLPARQGQAAARLTLGLSMGQVMNGTADDRDWPRTAVDLARGAGARPLLAGALAAWVRADQMTGEISESTYEHLDEASALVDEMPDDELAQLLTAVCWVATSELFEDRISVALKHLRRALDVARSAGQTSVIGQIHLLFALARMDTGGLAEAWEHLEDAREMAELTGSTHLTANVSGGQCLIAALQGNLDLALRLGRETFAANRDRQEYFAGTVFGPLAFALLHSGDPEGCVDVLTTSLERLESVRVAPLTKIWWHALLAEALAELGRPDEAAEWARRAEEHVGPWTPPRRRGAAHLAMAYALLAVDPIAALDRANAAADMFAAARDPLRHGQARMVTGTALTTLGETVAARAEFARARALFDGAGAQLFVMKALREETRLSRTTGV